MHAYNDVGLMWRVDVGPLIVHLIHAVPSLNTIVDSSKTHPHIMSEELITYGH